jgi:hypothetical protein
MKLRKLAPYLIVLVVGLAVGSELRPFEYPIAAAQPGCQTFSETGKTVCGKFLSYWQKNGGLAQQGYPLSSAFAEVSDLDGKTYTVQYFERAVFEDHPENQPPYDVLLSQLGTFQFQRKYPNGEPVSSQVPPTAGTQPTPSGGVQTVTGSGTNVSDAIALKKGLAVVKASVTGVSGNFENFIVHLVDMTGKDVELVANELGGDTEVTGAARVPDDGNYLFRVKAAGAWTIAVTQPTGTYSPPPASQNFSGSRSSVVGPFSLKAGGARFHLTHANGESNFIVTMMEQSGGYVANLANEIGPADISTIVSVRANGVYFLEIKADGDWTVSIGQ